jgi:hypothetical protein
MAREVYALTDAPRRFAESIVVTVLADATGDARLAALEALARRHPGPVTTMLRIACPDGPRVWIRPGPSLHVDPTPAFLAEAEKVVGPKGLRFVAKRAICLQARPERRWAQR